MLLISLWVAVHSRPHAQVLADNRFSIIIHRLLIVSESLLHLKPCLQKSSKYPQMWKSHCVYLIGNSIIVVPLRCDSQIISLCNVRFYCVPSHGIFSQLLYVLRYACEFLEACVSALLWLDNIFLNIRHKGEVTSTSPYPKIPRFSGMVYAFCTNDVASTLFFRDKSVATNVKNSSLVWSVLLQFRKRT